MLGHRRERLLAGGLTLALLVAIAGDGLIPSSLQPNARLKAERDRLQGRLTALQRSWDSMELAQTRIADRLPRSLPPDPAIAAALWQSALLEASREAGLERVTVAPAPPRLEGDFAHRIVVGVQAEGPALEVGDFLDRVRSIPVLQRMNDLTISPAGKEHPSEWVRLETTWEALSLLMAEPRQTLLPLDLEASPPAAKPAQNGPRFAELLATRDYFGEPESAHTPDPDIATEEPESDSSPAEPYVAPRATLRLLAAWDNGRESEAWLHDIRGNAQLRLRVGDPVQVGDETGKLVSIDRLVALFELDGHPLEVRLGQTFAEGTSPQRKSRRKHR